ncbi:hypothetical protein MRB53_040477 [Persea americana]|nr:hypothetical protein MRB53_040477 [Persea americana]
MTMDVQAIRARFPALARDQVFFDNAGGSQILGEAVEDMLGGEIIGRLAAKSLKASVRGNKMAKRISTR